MMYAVVYLGFCDCVDRDEFVRDVGFAPNCRKRASP
jgi:hypothetical protein